MSEMPVFGSNPVGTKTALEDIAIETGTPIEILFASGEQAGATTPEEFLRIARQRGTELGPRFKAGEDAMTIASEVFGAEAGNGFGDYATEIRAQLYGTPTVQEGNKADLESDGFLNTAADRGRQFMRGLTETAAAVPEARAIAAAQLDSEDTAAADMAGFDSGQKLRDATTDRFGAPNPEDQSFWAAVAEGAGNLVGMAGASLAAGAAGTLAGGPVGGVIAATATGGAIGSAMTSSQLYREARDMGADEAVAEQAARWGAAIGATEIVPIARAFKFLPQGVRQRIGNGVMKRFADVAQSSGEEAAQEYLATVAQNMVAQQLYDPTRGWTEGATEGALVGAVLGGGAGAIGAGVDELRTRRAQPLPDTGGQGIVPPNPDQAGMVPPVMSPPGDKPQEAPPSPMTDMVRPTAADPAMQAPQAPAPMSDALAGAPEPMFAGITQDEAVQITLMDPETGEVSEPIMATFVGEDPIKGYASFRGPDGQPLDVDAEDIRAGNVRVSAVAQPTIDPMSPPIPQGADTAVFMDIFQQRMAGGMSQEEAYTLTLQETLDDVARDVSDLANDAADREMANDIGQRRIDEAVFTDDQGQPFVFPSAEIAQNRLGAGYDIQPFGGGFIGARNQSITPPTTESKADDSPEATGSLDQVGRDDGDTIGAATDENAGQPATQPVQTGQPGAGSGIDDIDAGTVTEGLNGQDVPSNTDAALAPNYDTLIKIAADSIDKLRGQDVFRVLDEAPESAFEGLSDYIEKARPDLVGYIYSARPEILEARKPDAADADQEAVKKEDEQEQPVTPEVAEAPVASQETDPKRKAVADAITAGGVQYTTRKGKVLDGYVIKGFKPKDVTEFDTGAFTHNGGTFIRKARAEAFIASAAEASSASIAPDTDAPTDKLGAKWDDADRSERIQHIRKAGITSSLEPMESWVNAEQDRLAAMAWSELPWNVRKRIATNAGWTAELADAQGDQDIEFQDMPTSAEYMAKLKADYEAEQAANTTPADGSIELEDVSPTKRTGKPGDYFDALYDALGDKYDNLSEEAMTALREARTLAKANNALMRLLENTRKFGAAIELSHPDAADTISSILGQFKADGVTPESLIVKKPNPYGLQDEWSNTLIKTRHAAKKLDMKKEGAVLDAWTDKDALVALVQAELDRKSNTPDIDAAAAEADPNPTDPQKEAGNYKKGHAVWNGMNLTIENAKGSERSGTGPDGETWSVTMPAHYGYFKMTEGADGEHVDFYMGEAPDADYVMWVDQADADTGKFDEHKIMVGFPSRGPALTAYHGGFSDGRGYDRIGGFFEGTVAQLKAWLDSTLDTNFDSTKPVNGKLDFPFKKVVKDAPAKPKPAPTPAPAPAAPKGEKLEDFGATIGGARKHFYEAKKRALEAMDAIDIDTVDIETMGLNDVLPMPDFEKLASDGDVALDGLYLIAALRTAIPSKPVSDNWALRGWASRVREAHKTTKAILSGDYDAKQIVTDNSDWDQAFARNKFGNGTQIDTHIETNPEYWTDVLQPFFKRIEPQNMLDVSKNFALSEQWEFATKANVRTKTGKIVIRAMGHVSRAPWRGSRVAETVQDAAELANDWATTRKKAMAEARANGGDFKYGFHGRYANNGKEFYIFARKPKLHKMMTFNTAKERDDFLASEEGLETLNDMANELRDGFEERRRDNNDRTGPDWRKGKDVSAKTFMDVFGFRGGQFGNSVTLKERTAFLNATYDGLMDLAAVMGVAPKSLSLNGALGIAFGARGKGGKGAAAAHYEPGQTVINLTRVNGSGALAHEWFHGLDNYLAKLDASDGSTPAGASKPNAKNKRNDYMTGRSRHYNSEGALPESVYKAYRTLRQHFNGSGYQGRMEKYDKFKSAPYWSDPIEMGARSFEAWVVSHLEARDMSHDFLVNVSKFDGGALPNIQERGIIFSIFNQIMDELKSIDAFAQKGDAPSFPALPENSDLAPVKVGSSFQGPDGTFDVTNMTDENGEPHVTVKKPNEEKPVRMPINRFYYLRAEQAYAMTPEGKAEAAQAAIEAQLRQDADAMRQEARDANDKLLEEFERDAASYVSDSSMSKMGRGYFRGDGGNPATFIMDKIRNDGWSMQKSGNSHRFGDGYTYYSGIDKGMADFGIWAKEIVDAEKMRDAVDAATKPKTDEQYADAFDAAMNEVMGPLSQDTGLDGVDGDGDEAGAGDPQPDDAPTPADDATDDGGEPDGEANEATQTDDKPTFVQDGETAPTPGARDSLNNAKKSAAEGVKESMKALNTLFGSDMNRMNSGLTFDKETYKKALPHFKAAYRAYADASTSLVDAFSGMIRFMMEQGLDAASISSMKPYFTRFMKDVDAKAIDPWAADEAAMSSETEDMANAFEKALASGTKFGTINAARRMASETLSRKLTASDHKAVEEAMELAVVRVSRGIVKDGKDAAATFDALETLYQSQPLLAQRTNDSVRRQAYSTPAPLAYLASELAGIDSNTTVYEPTAGNGMLLLGADPKLTTANELDADRTARLRNALGADATITTGSALDVDGPSEVDVVIQNPPFGKLLIQDSDQATEFDVPFGKEKKTDQIDHAIVAKTLESMADDGRAVLIVGGHQGETDARKAKYRGKPRAFWNWLYDNYNVTEHFTVSGDLYKRQGAAWPVDVVVIEGRQPSTKALPMAEAPTLFETWSQLKERIDGTSSTLDARGSRADSSDSEGDAGSNADVGPVSVEAGDPAGTPDQIRTTGEADPSIGAQGGRGEPTGSGNTVDGPVTSSNDTDTQQRKPNEPDGAVLGGPDATTDTSTSSGPDVVQPSDAGDVGGRSTDVAPAKRVNTEQATDLQVQYEPRSTAAFAVGTLVPNNMQFAMDNALDAIAAEVGDIDAFVAAELGYDKDRMLNGDDKNPGYFSAEQVDALALSIYNIKNGAGFIIGDQTGVGKGRVVAAMMRWAERNDRVPVFLTARAGLFNAMITDMRDIGWEGDITEDTFVTNSDLRGKDVLQLDTGGVLKTMTPKPYKAAMADLSAGKKPEGIKRIFTTYSQMQSVKGAETPRRAMFRAMAPNSLFILDESHLAGGQSNPDSRMKADEDLSRAKFIRDILDASSGAFFSSATFAKSPAVMSLYAKTDLRLAVDDIEKLASVIENGGVPMQQIAANMLVQAGQYVRRERSYAGVKFNTTPYETDMVAAKAGTRAIRSVFELDRDVMQDIREAKIEELMEEGHGGAMDNAVGEISASSINFTSVMHNVVNQFVTAIKADAAADRVIEIIKSGRKPIIALSNTNESIISDFVGAAKDGDDVGAVPFNTILTRYAERLRRITVTDKVTEKKSHIVLTDADILRLGGRKALEQYNAALATIEGMDLSNIPGSPLDHIMDKVVAAGYQMGEITGRKTTVREGKVTLRSPTAAEKNRVMRAYNTGEIEALIINKSGAEGFSLHATGKGGNDGKPRSMIVLQPDADINVFMQLIGRIHRTGQIHLPEYDIAVSQLAVEKRPAAVLMRKMASLSANTTANKTSVVTLDAVDFMNKYGDRVMREYLDENPDIAYALDLERMLTANQEDGDKPSDDGGAYAARATGRMAILDPDVAEAAFKDIEGAYLNLIEELDRSGKNDLEAKTLDLDAKTKSSTNLTAGVADSTSPFSAPARFEIADVKADGNPMSTEDVMAAVKEAWGDGDILSWKRGMSTEVGSWAKPRQEKFDEAIKAKQDEYYAAGNEKLQSRLLAALGELKKGRQAVDETTNDLVSKLRDYAPGRPLAIVVKDDPDNRVNGVVLGIDWKRAESNPNARSKIMVHIALASPEREARIPLSMLTSERSPFDITFFNNLQNTADMFDNVPRVKREDRGIVTGNLLAGYEKFPKGQIVMFTRADGTTDNGILMPRNFDLSVELEKQPVPLASAKDVMSFIAKDQSDGGNYSYYAEAKTVDGVVSITRNSRGLYSLTVRSKGGKKYAEHSVIGREFGEMTKRGSKEYNQVEYDPAKIERVLKAYIDDLGAGFQAETYKGYAREVMGIKLPELDLKASARKDRISPAYQNRDTGQTGVKQIMDNVRSEIERMVGRKMPVSFSLNGPFDFGTEHGLIDGYFLDAAMGISLDAVDGPMGIARHEVIHALRSKDMFDGEAGAFTSKEWKTLVAAARKHTRLRKQIDEYYDGASEAIKIEEIVAEMFREWSEGADLGLTADETTAFERLKLVLDAIINALRGNGMQVAADVFERIRSGDVGGRGPDGPTGSAKSDAQFSKAQGKVVRFDNPGGGWLEGKQRKADEHMAEYTEGLRSIGLAGSVTGYIMDAVQLPVDLFTNLKGANGEKPASGKHKYDRLTESIDKDGWDADQGGNAILVGVNHKGQPYILEGNNRVAKAKELGVKTIKARIQWYNGAEDAGGPLTPAIVNKAAADSAPTSPDPVSNPELMASISKAWRKSEATTNAALDKKEASFVSNMITNAMAKNDQYNTLGLIPGEVLFRDLGKSLPSAGKWVSAMRKMTAERQEMHADSDKLAQEWQGAYTKDKVNGAKLHDLMHEATIAGVDPSVPFLAPKARGDMTVTQYRKVVAEARDAYATMKDKYKALPENMQSIFKKSRDAYKKFDDDLMNAMVDAVAKAMELQSSRLKAKFEDELQSIKDDGLEGAERDLAKKKARSRYNQDIKMLEFSRNARIRKMRLTYEANRIDGPYFPLVRFGQFFVAARDAKGKLVHFERAASVGAQQTIEAEMKADGFTVEVGVMKPEDDVSRFVDPNFVADITDLLGEISGDGQVLDAIYQRYLETLPSFSIRKANIHRQGIKGFDKDAIKAFGSKMFHGAHQLARLKYSTDLTKHIENARREAKDATDPTRAGAIANEMQKRHEWALDPKGSSWSAWATSASFVWYLGLTPGAAIVNLTQTTVVGIPILVAGIKGATVVKAAKALTGALADFTAGLSKGDAEWSRGALTSARLTADERTALEAAYNSGALDKSQAHDIAAIGDSGVEYSAVREKAMRPIAFLFHHAERLNREVTFLAAYRMSKESGLSVEDATTQAGNLTWDTHFNYENWSRPRFMQGDVARVAFVFKQFQINMLYRLFRDTHQSLKGESEEVRKQARAQLIGITGSMMLHAGITGTWGYALMMLLAGMFFEGGSDEAEEELKDAVVSMFGTGAGGMILKGVPGQLTGTNLTARIGMPELWFRSPSRQIEGRDAYYHFVDQALGAFPAIGLNMLRGASMVGDGEVWRGAELMVPKAVRDQMRFMRYLNEGVTTYKGDPLMDSISAHDAIVQAIGFSPARVSERYEQNRRLMNMQTGIQDERRRILGDVARYVMNGDEISPRALRQMRAFNQKYPTYPITGDTIKRSISSRQQSSQQNNGGIRMNAKLEDQLRAMLAPSISD